VQQYKKHTIDLAWYPSIVACSTNTGEGLVKVIMCNDIPVTLGGRVESGTFREKMQVSECTTDHKHRPCND